MDRKEEVVMVTQPDDDEGPVVTTVGMRGKRGMVTVHIHRSGLLRVYKNGVLFGEYDNATSAWDFARQQSGFGG
jgi:hypothetical protein